MDLTPQQREALDKIARWYEEDPSAPFRLFGPAGTGKTTLAKHVAGHLANAGGGNINVMYAAYTGKAASVLRGKGCDPASTLHSLIYRRRSNGEIRERIAEAQEELATFRGAPVALGEGEFTETRIAELEAELNQLEAELGTMAWEVNPSSPLAIGGPDLLILDEVSMVDAKLAGDLESFGVPILVLGDPEQLEPVGGEGYYTNAAPDVLLTEIHRQALDSPVLRLATAIRQGAALGQIEAVPHSVKLAAEHDQVLCWKNSTRWAAVNRLRALAGLPAGVVAAGDRIMCLTNNRDLGIYNGQQFEVLDSQASTLGPSLTVRDDEGIERVILAFGQGFEGQAAQDEAKRAYLGGKGNRGLFTFAQAITVHKAQGSEWGSVYIVDETPGMISMTTKRIGRAEAITQARRWMYTATTRASERVTITRTGRDAR